MVSGLRHAALRPEPAVPIPHVGLPSPNFSQQEELLAAAASLVFLAPAAVAVHLRRPWHAGLFAAAAAFGVASHALNFYALGDRSLNLDIPLDIHGLCLASLARAATWASQLCTLQVAFVILGPEDPLLHEVRMPTTATVLGRFSSARLSTEVPADVLLWARAFPALLLALLPLHSWRQSALLAEVLLAVGCATFWFSGERRRVCALDVLLRARFWQRTWQCLVLPALGPLIALVVAASTGWQALLAAAQAGVAVMAAAALRTVLGGAVEVLDRSPQNPTIAHRLLFCPGLILLPAAGAALALDARAHGVWRWPTLSMAATTPESAFILELAALPLAAAAASACWAVGQLSGAAGFDASKRGGQQKVLGKAGLPDWRERCRSWGCSCGYLGIAAGVLAASVAEGAPVSNAVHVACAVVFFSLVLAAVVLLTAASNREEPLGRLRVVLAGLLVVLMGSQLALFLLVNQYWRNDLKLPHSIYAITEYSTLVAFAAMPMTWMGAVREPQARQAGGPSMGSQPRFLPPDGVRGAKLSDAIIVG